MKRIQSACICQSLHFTTKDPLPYEEALKQTACEVKHYKDTLNRSCIQYRIVDEIIQEDGSILVKVIKQYNQSPVGDYLKSC